MATLHPRMFIAQTTLEAWMDSGRAELKGDFVHLERSHHVYRLDAAVRFISAVVTTDAEELVGRVLTEQRLSELGGELLGDSVLFGEAAFQIESGYIGTLVNKTSALADNKSL